MIISSPRIGKDKATPKNKINNDGADSKKVMLSALKTSSRQTGFLREN